MTYAYEKRRLKYVATINDEALSEDTDPDFELRYIDIGNVDSEGRIDQVSSYRFQDAPSRARRKVRHGDVIVSTVRTYLQAITSIENPEDNLIVSTGFAVVRPRRGFLDSAYGKYALRDPSFLHQVITRSVGVSYPAINASDLGDIAINLYPLEVQKRIASFLDRETSRIDALIAAKERLLELLAEKRRALITHAVTKGLDPAAPMRDSGIPWLGMVPKHWGIVKLKHIAHISYGVGEELDRGLTDGTPLISLPNVDINGNLHLNNHGWAILDIRDKEKLLLRKGDLLFNWRNGSSEHVGKTAEFNTDGEYTHVGFLLRIRFDSQHHNPKYYRALLNSLRATGFFYYTRAMVNNTFNQTELENLHVIAPPLEEQLLITEMIDRASSNIDQLHRETSNTITLLKERRSALIASAVTGKIQ